MEKVDVPSSHIEPLDGLNMLDDCNDQEDQPESSIVKEESNGFEEDLNESMPQNLDQILLPNINADTLNTLSEQTDCGTVKFNEEIETPTDKVIKETLSEQTDCGTVKFNGEIETPTEVEYNQPSNLQAVQSGDAEQYCEENCLEISTNNNIEEISNSNNLQPEVSPCTINTLNHTQKLGESLVSSGDGELKETIFSKPDSNNVAHETSLSEDVLPPSGLAKRLVDKWSNISVETQPQVLKTSTNEDFHYAPNTAKNIAAKFSSGNFQTNSNAHAGDEPVKKAYTNGTQIQRDLSANGDQTEAELPIEGITRGLIAKFSSMEA